MIAFSSLQARGKAASSFDTLRPDVEFRPRSEDAQRIAIIGGGFYGCHIAANLIRLGFDVTLLEKSDTLLSAASGANQFRLHLGFHYARDHATRIQSRDGFYRFVSEYPDLTGHVPENIYAVASGESLLDHETYRMIMAGSSIPFTEVESASVPVSNVDGMFLTEERVLLTERARSYFRAAVGSHAVLGHRVHSVQDLGGSVLVDGESFDFVIDATYGHFTRPKSPVYYEPTLMLYYETEENHPAVTMVDGPLYSVYPTEDPKVFTLSSVTETPLGRFDDVTEALAVRDSITTDVIEAKRKKMELQVSRYLPEFSGRFRYIDPQFSLKTKLAGSTDGRSCSVSQTGRCISVLSGKIDNVFHAADLIQRIISVAQPEARGEALMQVAA